MNRRRAESAERKFNKAVHVFDGIFTELSCDYRLIPQTNSVYVAMLFECEGRRYRFDYVFSLEERLPSVKTIRDMLWSGWIDYRQSVLNH